MKKHAYLIIAHSDYSILETLLSMLDDYRNDVYLHIDRRAEEIYHKVSKFKMQHAGFQLLSERLSVYWGDISQVEVEYRLFETAYNNGNYSYYHLLSGVDLLLKNQDYIHCFFDENNGKEFVGYWNDTRNIKDLDRKVSRYYFFLRFFKDKSHPLHGITSLCRNIVLGVQKIFNLRRKQTFEFKKGWNWVSITGDFCQYLIEQKNVVLKRFKYTLCPDEIFLQTILWNSPFRDNIYCYNDPQKGSMRMIDWLRGSPYVWQNSDFEELKNSDAIFARKFSSTQIEIVKKLHDYISSNNDHK